MNIKKKIFLLFENHFNATDPLLLLQQHHTVGFSRSVFRSYRAIGFGSYQLDSAQDAEKQDISSRNGD